MIQAGINADDIRIVDSAGGFGGTWYWNRYLGLMCDITSYIYMPLLEEMGYMPKHKYAYGPEVREYAESIAEKWGLREKTRFS
jgi:cation diffusion facilitator CzcD-associated flavoprotein CzcO